MKLTHAVLFAAMAALANGAWAAACNPGPGCNQLIFENQTNDTMTLYVDGEMRCRAQAHRSCSTFVTTPGRHSLKASGSQNVSETLEFKAGPTKTWRVFEQ